MPIPLPNLDTRRWIDLVDEGRAVIPRHSPGWTDFNVHDPGITVLEVLAWLVEQEQYRANRITPRHRAKFLELIGLRPTGARPARVVLGITPSATGVGTKLPPGLAFSTQAGGRALSFRTAAGIRLSGARLVAAVSGSEGTFRDLTAIVGRGSSVEGFGPDPVAFTNEGPELECAFALGFDTALRAGRELSLWIWLDGEGTTAADRDRVAAELAARRDVRVATCRQSSPSKPCDPSLPSTGALAEFEPIGTGDLGNASSTTSVIDDRATVAWEYWDGIAWRALDIASEAVVDETDGLRFSGAVRLTPPTATVARRVGPIAAPAHYIRARLARGRFDAAPRVRRIVVDAVAAIQVRPAWSLVPLSGRVATPDGGMAAVLGVSDGRPGQRFALPGTAIADDRVRAWVDGPNGLESWRVVPDLDASTANGAEFAIESRLVRLGDGRRGRIPPLGARIVVEFDDTAAGLGCVAAAAAWELGSDELNAAILGSAASVAAMRAAIAGAANPEAALGCADQEDPEHAAGRAAERVWAHERLVELAESRGSDTLDGFRRTEVLARAAPPRAATLLDLERLALELPGSRVARARAFSGVDPDAPCRRAPGTVSLIVIPRLPRGRPRPTMDLLADLSAYLDSRRVLGMRLVVLGPRYVEIGVQLDVAIRTGANADAVKAAIASELARFLDPLEGGATRSGWPFGRDVYRAEILAVIDEVPGVDHVVRLRITASPMTGDASGEPPTEPSCGNVCLGPAGLPVIGQVGVEVVP